MKKRAVCRVPVQIYGPEAGLYRAGDILEGERAAAVLSAYPEYFAPVKPAKEKE